jgi:Mce-associated membrane protein
VPSFRRRASAGDTDRVEQAPNQPSDEATTALTLAEQAEAQAAEAEAVAEAARARARAIRLRQEAEQAAAQAREHEADGEPGPSEDVEMAEEVAGDETGDEPQPPPAGSGRRWGRILKAVAMSLAILCTGALLAASGYMVHQQRKAADQQKLQAEYAAAGRQSVVTLMSLDFNNAEADVQRIIENSTGQFKTDFEDQAKDFVQVAKDSKVVTDVTVNSTAVEKMSQDSAVVLVAATSRVTNAAGAQQEPRAWRLAVDLQRDGDQIKMSKVEFVP